MAFEIAAPGVNPFEDRRRKPLETAPVPTEVKQSILSQLASQSGQALESLGLFLDTPGAIARGILAGDPASGFTFDSQRRVSGTELLDAYGLKPDDDTLGGYGAGLAGFATEVVTDPLFLLQGGLGAMSTAAKAAKAADVLQYAPKAAMAKMGPDLPSVLRAADNTLTGRATLQSLENARVPLTESTLDVRPIVGDRVARFRTTLEDVIDAAPDRPEAMRQVRDYLGSDEAVDAAMNQRLGNLFGVGFGSSAATFSPFSDPTTEKILDAFDYLGQSASWNPATRTAAALFDKRLDGRTDVAGQIDALKAHKTVDVAGRRAGDVLATQHGQLLRAVNLTDEAKQLLGADTMFSREGNDLALRLATGKPSHTDLAILAESPELDEWLQNWDAYRKNAIVRAEIQGLRLNEYQDAFGNEFNPRYAQEFDFGPVGKGTGQLDRAATIENMYSRNPDLALPGGDIELREISLLPMVREHAMRKTDSPFTDEDVGEEIARYIADKHGNPMITDAQGTGIARVMRKLNPNLPADTPAFSEHPINAQMRYMVNTEMRLATANHVYDSMAEAAKPGKFTQQSGGIHRSLDEVLGKYSGRLGFETTGKFNRPRKVVAEQLRARIAVRNGLNLNDVKLKNYYIPEDAADRLVRIADFYNVPEAQEEVGNMFNVFTSLFKGFVLSWPSRFTRDAYSNLASIWLETGDAPGAISGMWAASNILAGKPEKAISYLAKIPRYAKHIANGAIDENRLLREFERDVGGNGVLSGLATSDLLTSNREGKISQFIPGSVPVSISGGLSDLLPSGDRTPVQMLQDFGAIRNVTNTFETRNPVLNAGQKVGDAVDSMARLGGFLALLRKGIGPQQAAQRMKAALVDYASLTPFERHYAKNIFMWWSYQSRIGKYAAESLLNNPGGRYAQMIRAVNDLQRPGEEGYIPTSLRQQVAVRLPDSLQFNPGTTTYLKNIDLPGLDTINILQPAPVGQYFPVNVQGTIQELLNQSNPVLKSLGELAFNTDLYSKRPLQEARTSVDKIYAAATGNPQDRADPVVKAILQNAPGLGRPISLLGTVFDQQVENPGYRAAKILANELSGFKLQDVDPEYELLDARNKISEFLKRYQNTFTQRYIPEELLPLIPPQAQQFNAVDKELQQQLTEFYKRKRAARAFEGAGQ